LKIVTLNGTCDVSAGVRWRDWLVVASDEDNVLRAYRSPDPQPLELLDFSEAVGVDPEEPETDLEGVATSPDGLTLWIGSHGRSRRGKRRRSRERFFATRIVDDGEGRPRLELVGRPYLKLRKALRNSVAGEDADLRSASRRAPEARGGMSIEGIAFRGHELLIAFRNPNPEKLALLVPLQNPVEILVGDAAAVLGKPVYVDLGGRGIRALDAVGDAYLIVAGPYNDSGNFALFHWSGRDGDKPREIQVDDPQWRELNPEEIVVEPQGSTWHLTVMSDDGGRRLGKGKGKGKGKRKCKELPPTERCFRVAELVVPAIG
jgi:hypothetical protein